MENFDNEKVFAIKLADNEKKVRDKSIGQLRNYMNSRAMSNDPFSEEDLIKLWKGLHYCMWMCDKPLIQEDLTEKICNLTNCFNNDDKQVMLFFTVYYKTIIREWVGIDKWRMDKFMSMMRSMLRQSFAYLNSKKWDQELVKEFNKMMLTLPLNINDHSIPDGISYHLADIYLEELGKFGDKIKAIRAVKMLQPFIKLLAIAQKKQFVAHVQKRVFDQIIECSDVGIDPENEKELAETKAFGLQTGEEEDTSEYAIKFNYEKIATDLFKAGNEKDCLERNKKPIYELVKKFKALTKGVYPIDDYNFQPLYDEEDKKKFKKMKKMKRLEKRMNKVQ